MSTTIKRIVWMAALELSKRGEFTDRALTRKAFLAVRARTEGARTLMREAIEELRSDGLLEQGVRGMRVVQ